MKKFLTSNTMLKVIALALAVITWLYISGELRRQTLTPNPYSTHKK